MPIDIPSRGLWHRRDYRGGSPPRVPGAHPNYTCGFCGKVYKAEHAVRQHERDKHKALLEEGLLSADVESFNPIPIEE